MNKEIIAEIYDTFYFEPGDSAIVEATEDDLYFYRTFVGRHTIDVERGDCVYYLSDEFPGYNLVGEANEFSLVEETGAYGGVLELETLEPNIN